MFHAPKKITCEISAAFVVGNTCLATASRPFTARDRFDQTPCQMALHSGLRQQLDYVESPEVVSSDFVGSHRAGIVDGLATLADDKRLVLYVWYDNEMGYSHQVVRVLEQMAGASRAVVPARPPVRTGIPLTSSEPRLA